MRSTTANPNGGAGKGRLLDLEAIDWPRALVRLGVPEDLLKKRQGPCPLCGGRTRFRFTNKFNRGNWFCNHCGSGDGVALAAMATNRSPQDVLRELRAMTNIAVSSEKARADSDRRARFVRQLMARVWDQSANLARGDVVVRYLRGRMPALTREILCAASVHIRCHPGLELPEELQGEAVKRGLPTRWPAMVARVIGPANTAAGLHRTYLAPSGEKAPFDNVKFALGDVGTGAAVRIGRAGPVIGVCEGIETGLAVMIQSSGAFPVWPALSAVGMENVALPQECRAVLTFGDNDPNGRGFVAQDKLARRLVNEGRLVRSHYPDRVGWDFLNQLREAPVKIEPIDPATLPSVH